MGGFGFSFDCCGCPCGPFCTGGYCGSGMNFTPTMSGAANGTSGNCVNCAADLNVAMSQFVYNNSFSAATFNASGAAWQAVNAKEGYNACYWLGGGVATSLCTPSGATLSGEALYVYYGTDDKWHMIVVYSYIDANGYTCNLAGDSEFSGSGAPMDCGTPGELTPTFSLSIPLSRYDEVGTPDDGCIPPTDVLIEGDPQ